MEIHELLADLYGRVRERVDDVLDGLSTEELVTRPGPDANPIGWLVWHLTRVQDHHVSELLDREQIYLSGDWAPRFGLQADPQDIGYGHSSEEVAGVRPESTQALADYYAAVWARTQELLAGLGAADLDRIVDRRWDPPVTLGVRLVSIADDDLEHIGQAAYVKGLLRA